MQENKHINFTYDGMSGAGRACPAGRPPGTGGAAPPPGRFGIAGAGLPVAGGGGGPRAPPVLPSDPLNKIIEYNYYAEL